MTAIEETAQPATLDDKYPIPEGKTGIMHALCSKGDIPFMWNGQDPDDVGAARKFFADQKKKGYIAYRSEGKDGHRGQVIHDFEPEAERIIFVKQHVGG
jgi:hypothetical protein